MKSNRFSITAGIAFLAFLGFFGFSFMTSDPQEPVYQGRRLRSWISDLSGAAYQSAQTRSAEDAIETIGTNALPVILGELKVPDDSALMGRVYRQYNYWPLTRAGETAVRLFGREARYRRWQAAYALRVVAKPLGVSTLTNLMNDSNRHVQDAAAEALVIRFPIMGVEALMNAVGSQNVPFCLAALRGLEHAGHVPMPIAPLTQCLEHSDPKVRELATFRLCEYMDLNIPGVIEVLVRALDDPVVQIRTRAAEAFRSIRPHTIRRLEKEAGDADPAVQVPAARALTRIRAVSKEK